MNYTYDLETDIRNATLEKVAMQKTAADSALANLLLGGAGGALLGGLGGAASHYINGELNSSAVGGVDPSIANELRANKGSLMQAALMGALAGGATGLAGGSTGFAEGGARDYSALLGMGLGGLTGTLAGLAQQSPGDMARNYKAERIQHLGIPSDNVNIYTNQS